MNDKHVETQIRWKPSNFNVHVLVFLKLLDPGLDSKVQLIKYRARGFRNADRFERAIFFHLGGLDLSPTHTKA